jgi:hypothetical protein
MKHLKLFESFKEENLYGISPEELQYFFTDLTDDGYIVDINFKKRLKQGTFIALPRLRFDSKVDFNLDTYIEVKIKKNWVAVFGDIHYPSAVRKIASDLNNIIESEFYKDIIQTVDDRLGEFGLYIQNQIIKDDYILVMICKSKNEN